MLSVKEVKHNYFLQSILFGIMVALIFVMSSSGLFSEWHVLKNALWMLAFAPMAYIVQRVIKQNIFQWRWLPEYLLGLIIIAVLPCLMMKELNIAGNFIHYKGDVLFGSALFLFLIVLRILAFDYFRFKTLQILWALVYTVSWFIPIAQLVHHILYGEFIDDTSIIAVQQTNSSETFEWALTYLGPVYIAGVVFLFLLIALAALIYEHRYGYAEKINVSRGGAILLCLILFAATFVKIFPMTDVMSKWTWQSKVRKEQFRFNENYEERFAAIKLKEQSKKPEGTFVIIVGESATRDYMKAYNNDFQYDNTPWLSKMVSDGKCMLFENAYASYSLTTFAISRSFTESSQYNQLSFIDSMSVLDIAKKKGFKTYWFSNQLGPNFDEVMIHLISDRADVVRLSENAYDNGLLPLLKQVNPNEPNLIVLHGLGSHTRYANRYPEDCRIFKDKGEKADYANAVRYVDDFSRQVVEYAESNLNLQVVLYFADHGEDYIHGHGPKIRTWNTLRIPMWIYMTASYKAKYPEQANNLQLHKKEYFSNDMIYNTVCGIMGMESNHYDASEDFSSKDYAHNKSTITAFNGRVKISEDDGREMFQKLE